MTVAVHPGFEIILVNKISNSIFSVSYMPGTVHDAKPSWQLDKEGIHVFIF